MKTLIFLTISLFYFTVKAQDTLYFPSGEIQLVQLISVSKDLGLINYTFEGKSQIRSISSLKSYSNHANVSDNNWNVAKSNIDPLPGGAAFNSSSKQDPSKYSYGKFSIGANLLSVLSTQGFEFYRTIASNYNQSFYVQYNLNKKIGFRLPMRIGFNQLKDTVTDQSNVQYWRHDRDLIAEGGVEVLFSMDDNRKFNPYLMPGLYFGLNRGVKTKFPGNAYPYGEPIYFPSPQHNYYRVGITVGCQYNFSKYIQLNTELGFNVNNLNVMYYNQYGNKTSYNYVYKGLGIQAAVNLVYRFGGKLRK
jgi:hypothetical protein